MPKKLELNPSALSTTFKMKKKDACLRRGTLKGWLLGFSECLSFVVFYSLVPPFLSRESAECMFSQNSTVKRELLVSTVSSSPTFLFVCLFVRTICVCLAHFGE